MNDLHKRIKHQKEFILRNNEIETFFSKDFLLRFLKYPLWNYIDEIVCLYANYFKKLSNDCIYREAKIICHGRNFSANIFFDIGDHKFMLLMIYHHKNTMEGQTRLLLDILKDGKVVRESHLRIDEEILPQEVFDIAKFLTAPKIGVNNVSLLKIDNEHQKHNLSFHILNMVFTLKKTMGLSVLAGFQY